MVSERVHACSDPNVKTSSTALGFLLLSLCLHLYSLYIFLSNNEPHKLFVNKSTSFKCTKPCAHPKAGVETGIPDDERDEAWPDEKHIFLLVKLRALSQHMEF